MNTHTNLMKMELITCFFFKKRHFDIYRDKHGKYFVTVNGEFTQKHLVANEIVMYLSNAMNDR